jgi:N-acyl-phosphatidylethanolamine-hydrolysing phospholipase D
MTAAAEGSASAHHRAGGGFRNPWPTANGDEQPSMLRWWWERARQELAPNPSPADLPREQSRIASPAAPVGEIRATWIGHSSFLLQLGGKNLLTDPHWSERASPFRLTGPRRLAPPGVDFDALPAIDAVLISHDHYDHLDDATVRRIHARFGDGVTWVTPLGYAQWLARRGIGRVVELDWRETATIESLEVRCLPAQHWTSRAHYDRMRRLWCSWGIRAESGGAAYFGGDSGWFPEYAEIGSLSGPFDLVLMPIGAYDPRWFMRPSHMNPEEAVRAFEEMGGSGVLGGMHWGTFRLTDEDPLEPPVRFRQAWERVERPPEDLWIPRHGETRILPPR